MWLTVSSTRAGGNSAFFPLDGWGPSLSRMDWNTCQNTPVGKHCIFLKSCSQTQIYFNFNICHIYKNNFVPQIACEGAETVMQNGWTALVNSQLPCQMQHCANSVTNRKVDVLYNSFPAQLRIMTSFGKYLPLAYHPDITALGDWA